ncbi:MAG: hypothetical protein KDL87_01695 [Verrucomicrobiae bacterium]|nr:hypothetical protein [Verrucomicrobiae bacterium]
MAEPNATGSPATPPPIWLWPNLLCLDAPIVAVVWLGAFAKAYGVAVGWPGYVVLFLAVWSLYLVDRLVDSLKLRAGDPSPGLKTSRHGFMARHSRWFLIITILAVLVGGVLALTQLERPILSAGVIVAVGAAAYFGAFVSPLGGKKPLPGKELAAGILIAAGITVPVFADYSGALPVEPAFALFAGLCSLNCLMIASKDGDLPGGSGFHGLLTGFGIAVVLTAAGLALIGVGTEPAPTLRTLYLGEAISGVALVVLQFAKQAASRDAFRVLADVALLAVLIPLP